MNSYNNKNHNNNINNNYNKTNSTESGFDHIVISLFWKIVLIFLGLFWKLKNTPWNGGKSYLILETLEENASSYN